MVIRNETMEKRCAERIVPLLEDVHDARIRHHGGKVTFDRYAEAIGKPTIDPHHEEHAAVSRKAIGELTEMIAHYRKAEEQMQRGHAELEAKHNDLTSTTLKKFKGVLPKSKVRKLEDEINASKGALHEHQAGIYQMMNAREYIQGIKIR